MDNKQKPEVGMLMIVNKKRCRIVKVWPLGTVDVVSECKKFSYRVTGLPMW